MEVFKFPLKYVKLAKERYHAWLTGLMFLMYLVVYVQAVMVQLYRYI